MSSLCPSPKGAPDRPIPRPRAPLRRSLPSIALTLALAAGCGSRSNLLDWAPAETGGSAGASGGSGGSSTTLPGGSAGAGGTTTTTTTNPPTCDSLLVQPTFTLPPTSGVVSKPRTALLPPENDAAITALVAGAGQSDHQLVFGRLDAFGPWPPAFSGPTQLDAGVGDYEMGPGPTGPVLLVEHPGAGSILVPELFPSPTWFDMTLADGDQLLFMTAVQNRYFWAFSNLTPDYDVLDVHSYQPGNLPQTEQPLVCTTHAVKGAAIRAGQGFLAAFTVPFDPDTTCPVGNPKPGAVIELHRYDSPPEVGSMLQHTEGLRFDYWAGEEMEHLALAPAPFGAWVVLQSNGATAEVPPPIQGFRVDPNGQYVGGPTLFELASIFFIPLDIAVAAVGDDLALAWIDAIDPSAPTIQIQLIHPDGSKGAATSIPTNDAWYSGGLQLLSSADGNELLVSWVAPDDKGTVALARVDCVQGI